MTTDANRPWLGLSPLPKLGLFAALTFHVFWIDSLPTLGWLAAALAALLFVTRVDLGFFKWLLLLGLAGLPFSAALFLVAAYEQTGEWSTAWPLALHDAGLFILRLKVTLLANIIVVRTTSLRELTEALRSLRLPDRAVLFLATIVRFLPLSLQECRRIVEVQRCRGLRWRGLMDPRNLLPIFIPLLLSHMRLAHEMALSLEIRHFSWTSRRRREPPVRGLTDAAVLALALILIIAPQFLK